MQDIEIAQKLIRLLGGEGNIESLSHCMTRLRVTVRDRGKVDEAGLRACDGVLGVAGEGRDVQVVLGPGKAARVAEICLEQLGPGSGSDERQDDATNAKDDSLKAAGGRAAGSGKRLMRVISGIFVPLLPAIIGAGLLGGFGNLIDALQQAGRLPTTGFWEFLQVFLSLVGKGFLSYFAIFVGVEAARQFGATPALGGIIGAISISSQLVDISQIVGLYDVQAPMRSILNTGRGGLIGVIGGVYLLSMIEKWIRRRVPDVLQIIVTPFCSLLISTSLFVLVIMPLAGFISDGLVMGLGVLIDSPVALMRVFSGFLLAALFLPMVLLGLHHGLIPIYAVQLETMGGISLFPALLMAGLGQIGAAVCIYFKAKKAGNASLCRTINGALPAALMGIGEPLIYGVSLPLGRPFVTAGIGAGLGGAYVMYKHVLSVAWQPSGLLAVTVMKPESALDFLIGALIAIAGGFVVTQFLMPQRLCDATHYTPHHGDSAISPKDSPAPADNPAPDGAHELTAFLSGRVVPIAQVPDEVFSAGTLGDGAAIIPTDDTLVAPSPGKVIMLADTSHALGMRLSNGVELLLHIGLDTVALKGKGFTPLVKEGDDVGRGSPLIRFDAGALRELGVNLITMMTLVEDVGLQAAFQTGLEAVGGKTVIGRIGG